MHIVTITPQKISIRTQNIKTDLKLQGVVSGVVTNPKALQQCIKQIIIKHEALHGREIDEVYIVCNTFGVAFERKPKIQKPTNTQHITYVNSFTMKTCKLHEVYHTPCFNLMMHCFTEIGINVLKVLSSLTLFLLGNSNFVLSNKFALLFVDSNKTHNVIFDGNGGVAKTQTVHTGVCHILQNVCHIMQKKFSYLNQNVIYVILQNFLCLSEQDFIEHIQNISTLEGSVVSQINYEVVQQVTSTFKKELSKVLELLNLNNINKVKIYINYFNTQAIVEIIRTIITYDVDLITDNLIIINNIYSTKRVGVLKNILNFIF